MAGSQARPHRPDAVLERNLATFNTAWSAHDYSRDVGLWPIEGTLVARHFPAAPADVLDIGCGAGRTSVGLHARGYRVVAIDLSDSLLSIARSRYAGIDFQKMDARELQFEGGAFDAAIFSYNGIDSLYPESTRTDCFREILRVLKPGGVFVFSTHNLIGALFSGGWWYPRGYWKAAQLLWSQRTNAIAREWYIHYDDGGGGSHIQFSGPPGRTVRQLHDAGFELLDTCGSAGERRPKRILLHEQHVNFVARRPSAP